MKPGYKTTEFWLSLAALVLGAVVASGAVDMGSPVGQIVGLGISVLAALGYTTQRGMVKAGEAKAGAAKVIGALNPPSEPK